jgi:hypothetical protein
LRHLQALSELQLGKQFFRPDALLRRNNDKHAPEHADFQWIVFRKANLPIAAYLVDQRNMASALPISMVAKSAKGVKQLIR